MTTVLTTPDLVGLAENTGASGDVVELVRRLYARGEGGEWSERAEELLAAARALFAFGEQRAKGTAKVRVYQPSVAEHGFEASATVVEVVNDDMPFLVDSVSMALGRQQAEVQRLLHPIVVTDRDASGRLRRLYRRGGAKGSSKGTAESWMQIFLRRQPVQRHAAIHAEIESTLAEVRLAVTDWQAMRSRCRELTAQVEQSPPPLAPDEIAEAVAFLEWLEQDHFTYLGVREYQFLTVDGELVGRVSPGLGILRDTERVIFEGMRNLGRLPEEIQQFVRAPRLIRITKANAASRVHRDVNLDTVSVKSFDARGTVVGEVVFAGLFTADAYAARVTEVPILRQRVQDTIDSFAFEANSHNAKTLQHVLQTYPRDELFQINDAELKQAAGALLELNERPRVSLLVRVDAFERFVSALVFVPRERYDTQLRLALQRVLEEAYGGSVRRYYTSLGDGPLARLHVILKTTPGKLPRVDTRALERRLAEASESWRSRLERLLHERLGEERGDAAAVRFADAFSAGYREHFSPSEAVADVVALSEALERGLALRTYRQANQDDHELTVKVFTPGSLPALSEVLPMLQRMGLKVLYETSHPVAAGPSWVRELLMRSEDGAPIPLDRVSDFELLFGGVWNDELENDGFNRLVLFGGLRPSEVRVLRAYSRFLRQARAPFSQTSMQDALVSEPAISRALMDLFLARFDPERAANREQRASAAAARVAKLLDQVEDSGIDRILRRFCNTIVNTLRTSFFQRDGEDRELRHLALKLDSTVLAELPEPRPWREIWIYSPHFEAVHLRGGPVARGGIRWSDRRDDFRTEVLSLMKAQMVKNAVIVPVGAKGGFYVKRLSKLADRAREQVVEAYRGMIRALLLLTDNRRGESIAPPERVVRWDGDDPYLVVAADKGTASFSDVANAIAAEHGFWLDDAFASGGSAGYDHKGMAITARGAWESIKRHFRELGVDPLHQPITVVGVGDMSGDVFGNGMLYSRTLRLVGAFDHRHVFLDPDPEPATSWAERSRLFERPGSSWADYDRKRLSPGGGVFDRKAKTIALSPQAAARLGVAPGALPPAEVLRALLRAPVDLLYFGGIGTYVKGTAESGEQVGDRANETHRVGGRELRARVVAEGANLGLTQSGRVECALAGGRLNTDFIDNSGGVDCSDHEVNLKVLLQALERAGAIDRAERDRRLRAIEGEVAELVLRDNFLQNLNLSVTEHLGTRLTPRLGRFVRALQREGRLDRRLEQLPSDDELEDRARRGKGFVRPELATLLSYSKIDLYRRLVDGAALDAYGGERELRGYFPRGIVADFGHALGGHRLRREIIATVIANLVINRGGVGFVRELTQGSARPSDLVAVAACAARSVLGLDELWRQLEQLPPQVDHAAVLGALADCGRMLEAGTAWLLGQARSGGDVALLEERYRGPAALLAGRLEAALPEPLAEELRGEAGALAERGVGVELARRLAATSRLAGALDVLRLATDGGRSLEDTAGVYFAVAQRFALDRLRRAARSLPTAGPYDRPALVALGEDLLHEQRALAERVLLENTGAGPSLERWCDRHAAVVAEADAVLSELRSQTLDLASLSVAVRALARLVGATASG